MKALTSTLFLLAAAFVLTACDAEKEKPASTKKTPQEILLTKGIRKDQYNQQLLIEAAGGSIKTMKLLLKAGADINTTDASGCTPLHLAYKANRSRAIKFLIRNGADVTLRDQAGHTPEEYAPKQESPAETDAQQPPASPEPTLSLKPDAKGWTPLHEAARTNNVEQVKKLLPLVTEFDKLGDKDQWTPLHAAAYNGSVEVLELLLAEPFDIDAKDAFGRTPLHDATRMGELEAARLLMMCGASLQEKDNKGKTPEQFVRDKDRAVFVVLAYDIEHPLKGTQTTASPDGEGNNELHHAVLEQNPDKIYELLAKGYNPDEKNNAGNTPLHLAVQKNNIIATRVLLAAGADVKQTDSNGESPLNLAAQLSHNFIVRLIIRQSGKKTQSREKEEPSQKSPPPIPTQASQSRPQIKNKLDFQKTTPSGQKLEIEPVLEILPPNEHIKAFTTPDSHGWTPLHEAIKSGRLDIVKKMLPNVTNYNMGDNEGRTYLHTAAYNGHLELVRLLLQYPVDINIRDKSGRTPLHHAAHQGHRDPARLLVICGAKTDTQDQDGRTAAELAILQQKHDAANLLNQQEPPLPPAEEIDTWQYTISSCTDEQVYDLTRQGVDFNQESSSSNPALHEAISQKKNVILRILITAGADLNHVGDNNMTPLQYARFKINKTAIYLLEQAGAQKRLVPEEPMDND